MAFDRKVYHKKYYAEHSEALKAKSRLRHKTSPYLYLLGGARRRAKQAGLPCDIEESDIIVPDVCPILEVPLIPKTRYAPTVDRIEPDKGYTKGNVWVISRIANQMKSNSTPEEQRKFAEWVNTLAPCPKTSTPSSMKTGMS